MVQLCEIIAQFGKVNPKTGKKEITFKQLFDIYTYISDKVTLKCLKVNILCFKVVGMLLRCRKHKMVDFEGEMLFQVGFDFFQKKPANISL